MENHQFTINEEQAGKRVDQVLSEELNISRALVKKYKDTLTVNNETVKLSYKVKNEDELCFSFEKIIEVHNLEPEDIPVPIVFEDEHLLVANKPFGMVVHPAKGNWSGTLVNALYSHLIQASPEDDLRPGIVHRLDKETSGLIVMAKTRDAQEKLVKMFKDREITKIYQALVEGFLVRASGEMDWPIGRHHKNRVKFAVNEEDGKEAFTEYRLVKEMKDVSLVELQIHTGRTHQIRVHLNHLGNPVVGDKLYGRRFSGHKMCLVAKKLGFHHPITNQYLEFEIELPDYFNQVMNKFES